MEDVVDEGVEEVVGGRVRNRRVEIVVVEVMESVEVRGELREVVRSREWVEISEEGIGVEMRRVLDGDRWVRIRDVVEVVGKGVVMVGDVDGVGESVSDVVVRVSWWKRRGGGNVRKENVWV